MASLFLNSSPQNRQAAAVQYGNQTVQAYLTGTGAGINAAAVSCAGGNTVFLNYNNFGGAAPSTNEAILMHEALHNFTGLSDYQIQSTLSGYGLSDSDSSNNITALLEQKCVH
jgi:hypothetical protein